MTTINPNEATPAKPSALPPKVMDSPRDGRLVWLILYALNLIVPTYLATMIVEPLGWIGVLLAVGLLAWAGRRVLVRYPGMTWPAVFGAAMVGLCQMYPFLQVFAGRYAIGLAKGIMSLVVDQEGPTKLGIVGGFLSTIFTGLELLAVSLVIGWLEHSPGRSQPSRRTTSEEVERSRRP